MDYKKKIAAVQARIDNLRKIKEIMFSMENTISEIENEIVQIDNSLPSDQQIAAMPDGAAKEQILHLIDLNDEAFRLIDELLGPPDDNFATDQFFTSDAGTNPGRELTLEEAMKFLSPKSKGHAS